MTNNRNKTYIANALMDIPDIRMDVQLRGGLIDIRDVPHISCYELVCRNGYAIRVPYSRVFRTFDSNYRSVEYVSAKEMKKGDCPTEYCTPDMVLGSRNPVKSEETKKENKRKVNICLCSEKLWSL